MLIKFDYLLIFCYNNKREICEIVEICKIIEIIKIINVLFRSLINRLIFIVKIKIFNSIIVIKTKIIRNIKKLQLIILKNDVNDCRFFFLFRDSKFEKTKSKIIKRKQFVLKTNDSNKNKFFEFLRKNLKLKIFFL